MRKVPLDDDVNAERSLRAARPVSPVPISPISSTRRRCSRRAANKRVVGMEEFEKAKDKIMMGTERRSMVMSEKEKLNTAYHEAGHAIVGYCRPGPRSGTTKLRSSRVGGHSASRCICRRRTSTAFRKSEAGKSDFVDLVRRPHRGRADTRSGRDHVTTGASNDIERATEIARNMVTKWGLSERARTTDVQRGRRRGLPGTLRYPAQAGLGCHGAYDRRRGAGKIIDRNYDRAKVDC